MLTFGRRVAHDLTQVAEFVIAQSPLPPLASELPNTFGWIFADDVEASGMTEQSSQRADGPAGHAGPSGRAATTPFLPAAG